MKSNWITPCRGYVLLVTAASWRQIERECSRSGEIETGGILVGHYTTDESMAVVSEALSPPKDSVRGRSWFYRGVAGLRGLLAKRWESQVSTYYIGEWHYHPANIVEPSGDDLAQMYGINADPRYCCREPVMLIVGQAQYGDERPVRAFVFPRGEQYVEFEQSCSHLGTWASLSVEEYTHESKNRRLADSKNHLDGFRFRGNHHPRLLPS